MAEIEKHAMQSESLRRRKAFVELVSLIPDLNIKTDKLDTNPWLLNVKNGTVDLKTGELREHRQGDMIGTVQFPAQPDKIKEEKTGGANELSEDKA